MHFDCSLRVWFDKDISCEFGGDLSADIVSLLHLITSRDNEKLCDDSRLIGKQSVKLSIVEPANALTKVKCLCKNFDFTKGILEGSLAEGRKSK